MAMFHTWWQGGAEVRNVLHLLAGVAISTESAGAWANFHPTDMYAEKRRTKLGATALMYLLRTS